MKFYWNTNEAPWVYNEETKSFTRMLIVEWDDGSGMSLFVSTKPQENGVEQSVLRFGSCQGGLWTTTRKHYTDIMVADLDFFAPYVAYFEMRHWQYAQRMAAKYHI